MSIRQLAILTARNLRKEQTKAEKLFWSKVRRRQINGFRFLRQHPVFFENDERTRFFVADFYCEELRLVVEIDGGIHEKQKDYDMLRAEIMKNQKGLKVVRFSNNEVLNNSERVVEKLIGIIKEL